MNRSDFNAENIRAVAGLCGTVLVVCIVILWAVRPW